MTMSRRRWVLVWSGNMRCMGPEMPISAVLIIIVPTLITSSTVCQSTNQDYTSELSSRQICYFWVHTLFRVGEQCPMPDSQFMFHHTYVLLVVREKLQFLWKIPSWFIWICALQERRTPNSEQRLIIICSDKRKTGVGTSSKPIFHVLHTSAGSIHDTIEYRRLKNIFWSILGSFENRRIENNDYEMVIHGFLSIIL